MITIVVPHNQLLLRNILLHSAPCVLCAESDQFIAPKGTPRLVLASPRHFSHFSCDRALLIARKPADIPAHISCPHTIAIIDSANSRLRRVLYEKKWPTLTCGRSDTDTFTLTSLTDDSAVISLGRSICTFDHFVIEPFELPVFLSIRADPFELMAACAALCMLGRHSSFPPKQTWDPTAYASPQSQGQPRI